MTIGIKAWVFTQLAVASLAWGAMGASGASAFPIEVHGHRGARARFPENTIPAFEYAMDLGVDYLEMDMAVTRDNHIVISHDPHILDEICLGPDGKRITDPPLIHRLSLKEVERYDCGTIKNPHFSDQTPVPGTRIPRLADVFEMVRRSHDPHARTIRFNIETKSFKEHPEYSVDPDTFVRLFLKVIHRYGMEKRVILESFDYRTLDALRKYDKSIPTVALVEDPQVDILAAARQHHVNVVSPDYHLINKKLVRKLHAMKVRVIPWTADDASAWRTLLDMKVDGIITDDPASLIRYLRAR